MAKQHADRASMLSREEARQERLQQIKNSRLGMERICHMLETLEHDDLSLERYLSQQDDTAIRNLVADIVDSSVALRMLRPDLKVAILRQFGL